MQDISLQKMYKGFLSGAVEVIQHMSLLNRINVFPVPDGDTGTNLYSTMNAIIKESCMHNSIRSTLHSIAESAMKGARGNSGIIFSQYLYGLSIATDNTPVLSVSSFVTANKKAADYAYSAITNPVEGTIVTVMKAWADALAKLQHHSPSFNELVTRAYLELEKAVTNTKEQLLILKKNHVVDSGAKGFALFMKGFLDYITAEKELDITTLPISLQKPTLVMPSHEGMKLTTRYCTEAMIQVAPDYKRKFTYEKQLQDVKETLSRYGDSLIVSGGDDFIRIHIHTDTPTKVFDSLATKGTFTFQKVDDMKLQMDVVNNRRFSTALVTDTIADIPQSFIDEYQIHVLPLNVMLGKENYLDRLTIHNKRLLEYIDQRSFLPKSSQPDYKSVENLYNFLASYYNNILVIPVSAALSGTYNVLQKVATDKKQNLPSVHVLDSKLNSAAQGLLVMKCAELIAQGKSVEEVIKEAKSCIPRMKILVSLKSIDNMIKSGRLSTKAGSIAKALRFHPIVSLDENGKGALGGFAFSFQQSKKKLISTVKRELKKKGISSYAIVHAQNREEANELASTMQKIFGFAPTFIEEIAPITSISAGRGALAVAYLKKE